ncbi:MAG: hypothetical protein JXR94_20790 [Candidatus Hydrogenedentes bacterium]|nr:hypothetical protein [Candidatus Hydrogenedentota bacterium]
MTHSNTAQVTRVYHRLAVGCLIAALALAWPFAIALQKGRRVDAVVERGVYFQGVKLLCLEYAREHAGRFPELRRGPGRIVFDRDGLHSSYRLAWSFGSRLWGAGPPVVFGHMDSNLGFALGEYLDDWRYFYLGYAVTNEDEARAFAHAYRIRAVCGFDFGSDLWAHPGHGTLGTDALCRLDTGLAAALIDAGVWDGAEEELAARIPILIERPRPGPEAGGWVAYLDGHAEYVPYPGPFPMTPEFFRILGRLEALDKWHGVWPQDSFSCCPARPD